jgi:DeoR/GlpR family transcriptional regulator of sugar metabolism
MASTVERQRRLLAWIEQRQRASVSEITSHFSVSPATARRDLEALASQEKVERVHGGALAVRRAPPEAPVSQRASDQAAEKERIAAAAVQLVADGETIFLSSGTTTEAVARRLHQRMLTVITNSLLVINALADAPNITLIALGGTLRHSELSFIGPLTTHSLTELRAMKVIMGIRAIDIEQGLTNAYLEESLIDRAILSNASQVILVADHTKCGRVSAVFVAPLTKIDMLITDEQTPRDFVQALREQEISVVQV